jgi:hypothetical protein
MFIVIVRHRGNGFITSTAYGPFETREDAAAIAGRFPTREICELTPVSPSDLEGARAARQRRVVREAYGKYGNRPW